MELITLTADNLQGIPHFPISIDMQDQYEIAIKSHSALKYISLLPNWTTLKGSKIIINNEIIFLDNYMYSPLTLSKELNSKQKEVKFSFSERMNKVIITDLTKIGRFELIIDKNLWSVLNFENYKLKSAEEVEKITDGIAIAKAFEKATEELRKKIEADELQKRKDEDKLTQDELQKKVTEAELDRAFQSALDELEINTTFDEAKKKLKEKTAGIVNQPNQHQSNQEVINQNEAFTVDDEPNRKRVKRTESDFEDDDDDMNQGLHTYYFVENYKTSINGIKSIVRVISTNQLQWKEEVNYIRLKTNIILPKYAENFIIPVTQLASSIKKLIFLPMVQKVKNGYITLENINGKPLISINGRPEITLIKRRNPPMYKDHNILLSLSSSQNKDLFPKNNAFEFQCNITLPKLRPQNKYIIAFNQVCLNIAAFQNVDMSKITSMKIALNNVEQQVYGDKKEPYITLIPIADKTQSLFTGRKNVTTMYFQENHDLFFPIRFPNDNSIDQTIKVKIWFDNYNEQIVVDDNVITYISFILREI